MKKLMTSYILISIVICSQASQEAVEALSNIARPLTSAQDLDPLLERVGGARLVLLGEASHGTSEYYTWRADISRRLVQEHGYNFIAVEGDWATIYKLNLYVRGMDSEYESAREIMRTFERWPVWMWANEETRELVEWMREYNRDLPFEERVGFYGMDVYGEAVSIQRAVTEARAFDEDLAAKMSDTYSVFAGYAGNIQQYARSVAQGRQSQERNVRQAFELAKEAMANYEGAERYQFFSVKMNAKVVKNAERHARKMINRDASSWNARASHFYMTVERLLALYGEESRGIAWAHNTHIGDARATAMVARGQHNIGQLARQSLGRENVVSVGFGSYRGTVQAGRRWGDQMQTMRLPKGVADSAEDIMHRTELSSALFIFEDLNENSPLHEVVGHRAVGVVYNPEREREGNYVPTVLPLRYDAFIFIDETRALSPID